MLTILDSEKETPLTNFYRKRNHKKLRACRFFFFFFTVTNPQDVSENLKNYQSEMQKVISQIQTGELKIMFAKSERLSKASSLKLVKSNEENWETEIRTT